MTTAPTTRRRAQRTTLPIVALASIIALASVIAACGLSSETSNVGTLEFTNPLQIPPLLAPETDSDGVKHFDLELQTGTTEFVAGAESDTWGVNGAHLGPTLRAARGDQIAVRVRNSLPEASTVHWHGMHLPATADGGPHAVIDPGATWEPTWTVDQPAATLWYHPHLHERTEAHVYRGVFGMFILDDDTTNPTLPSTYGVDDIPLMIQDPRLRDGILVDDDAMIDPIGRLGSDILVNGTHDPHFDVTTRRVRLRLLNASPARTYRFAMSDQRPLTLIGTDGGLLPRPARMQEIQLSPGERAEIIIEFDPDDEVVLTSTEPDLDVNWWDARHTGANDTFDIIQFRAAAHLDDSPTPSDQIDVDTTDDFDIAPDAPTRRFEMSGIEINGHRMDMGRIDLTVPVDTTEIWEIHNPTGTPHSFHVHDTRFRILDVNGTAPPPELGGWKDTIAVNGGTTLRIGIRFTDYTDANHPYMYHCHLLRHEDQGMMGQFVVVEQDTSN